MKFDKRDFGIPLLHSSRNEAPPLGVMRVTRPEAGEDQQVFDPGAQAMPLDDLYRKFIHAGVRVIRHSCNHAMPWLGIEPPRASWLLSDDVNRAEMSLMPGTASRFSHSAWWLWQLSGQDRPVIILRRIYFVSSRYPYCGCARIHGRN